MLCQVSQRAVSMPPNRPVQLRVAFVRLPRPSP